MIMNRPRAISLFSGCGGSDLALKKAGFRIVWANDIWETACQTYRDNFGDAAITCGDISKFQEFPAADVLVGCYPCQGYSQAGRRKPEEEINYLYREFDRVLRKTRPKALVVENVNGMAYGRNFRLLQNQVKRFRLAGYRVVWRVLDAKDYGLPQTRKRVFIVGVRSDLDFEFEFPRPTHGPGRKQGYRSQFSALANMRRDPEDGYCQEKMHWYYLSRNRRQPWGQPSQCIVGHWRHVPLHPSSPALRRIHTDKWIFRSKRKPRRLSFRECAALQGFPTSYIWKRGNLRDRFQMIGNAVPPPLFYSVLRKIQPLWGRGE
jgi:DNA (cytosine-5)-methyltransferase 1